MAAQTRKHTTKPMPVIPQKMIFSRVLTSLQKPTDANECSPDSTSTSTSY
jgi:hypothetical protein